jgi:hypothetical protein
MAEDALYEDYQFIGGVSKHRSAGSGLIGFGKLAEPVSAAPL